MKIKELFSYIGIIVVTFVLAVVVFALLPKELEDVPYFTNNIQFDYEELKEQASVIALVEVMDELTEKNSEKCLYQDIVIGYIGRRTVKVLEYFKDERNYGDTLTIIEPTSIMENRYIHPEGYEKLEKGNKYLVYLSDETTTEELGILSAGNGAFDIDDLNANDEYYDLAIKSVVEYMTDLPDGQKEIILNADEIIKADNIKNADIQAEVTETESEIDLNFKVNADGTLEVQIK